MFRILTGALYIIFFLTTCEGGNSDWVLSSNEIYEVNAYINNYTLNECSIIRQNDVIRPYFVHSAANDPDVRGLIVFFQNPAGTVAGKKTWYTTRGDFDTEQEDDDRFVENPDSPAVVGEPEKTPEPPVEYDPEIPSKPAVIDEPKKTPEPAVESDPEIPSKPAVIDEPENTPEPAMISYEIPDITIRENAIENWSQYRMIQIERLDRNFPTFKVTEKLEIGQYLMVFQVLGEKGMLYQIEKPIYFLGNLELTFDDIQCYLPGLVANTYFIPPGINILLEAQVIADKQLDPYIIWYYGKKSINEGSISAGANRFIWKVPEQNGFHLVRAVIFPFRPSKNSAINGTIKELSLAVSSKSKNLGYFSQGADRFVHWYQFQSNLLDSKSPGNQQRSLYHKDNGDSQWATYTGGMYGLAVGTSDRYFLPDTSFIFSQEEQGLGQLMFHVLPLSDGTIFNAGFKTFDKTELTPSDLLTMNLSLDKRKLLLTLTLGDTSCKEAISLETFDPKELITPSIAFQLRPSQIIAQLSLKESKMQTQKIIINLPNLLTGEGTFQLGEPDDTPRVIAIFDELGIAFTKTDLSSKWELDIEAETEISEEVSLELADEKPKDAQA